MTEESFIFAEAEVKGQAAWATVPFGSLNNPVQASSSSLDPVTTVIFKDSVFTQAPADAYNPPAPASTLKAKEAKEEAPDNSATQFLIVTKEDVNSLDG